MFKRHNGRRSETDLRLRRSLEATRSITYARSSEQISRRPSSPPPEVPQIITTIQENHAATAKPTPRFSLMRFRHASDSAIGQRARDSNPPPVPTSDSLTLTPSIIRTAPTNDFHQGPPKRTGTIRLWRRGSSDKTSTISTVLPSDGSSQRSSFSKTRRRETGSANSRTGSSMRTSRVTFDEPERPRSNGSPLHEPPAYDDQMSSLPIPPPRLSESSRSTASSSDHYITTTTTQTTTTTTTFFRLARRKKKETSLFPLPLKVEHSVQSRPSVSDTELTPPGRSMSMTSGQSPAGLGDGRDHQFTSQMLAASGLGFAGPGGPGIPILRSNSTNSARSAKSTPTSVTPTRVILRDRSSTMSSLDRAEGRGSIGRKSFGGMFGRIRRDSEPIFGGPICRNVSPQPYGSGLVSLAVSQEIVIIPKRNDEDTPQMYLSKLFEALSKSVVASLLARNGDVFHLAALKAYMGTFEFVSTPMDMALR